MLRASTILSLASCLLVLPQQSFAASFSKREDDATATDPNAPVTTLEPVLPPQNDPEDFSILNPDTKLNLFYGGVPEANVNKRDDSESGILVNLDVNFLHPSVPLDHSSFISGVSCRDDHTLTGVFSTAEAFAFGKNKWTGVDKLLLITSTDGCGADSQNDVFLAHSITFSEDDLSFTATGREHLVKDVAEKSDITWGNVTPNKLRKRAHKRSAGQYADIVKRLCFTECDYEVGFDVSLGYMIAGSDGMEVDEDAPWDNAVLLASFGPDEDESGSEKRQLATTTDLAERDGLDYGLKLYCVDCGFSGTATATGEIGINFLEVDCYNAKITLSGNMHAGMYLGLEMFVEYTKTYEKDFIRQYLNPWEIPLILEFGPYIRLGIEASIDIKAEGTLLLGAGATWGGFEAVMDFLDPTQSYSTGFDPTIDRKAEAEVELSAEATLGLPVGIGLGVTVFSVWSVDVELTDTPQLVADASFKISGDLNECEGPDCDDDDDDEDECEGGIAWSVGFKNVLEVSVTGFDPYEIDTWESEPLADGCIQILDNGGDGDCKPKVVAVDSPADGTTCGTYSSRLLDQSPRMGTVTRADSFNKCARRCIHHDGCASFSFNPVTSYCRMYSSAVADMSLKAPKTQNKVYNDVGCYQMTTCEETQ